MVYDPRRHNRRSIRLKGYDYSRPGAYFVTICTYRQQHLFGDVVAGQMRLNDLGRIAQATWDRLPNHYQVELDAFVVMPNHVHGIIVITDPVVVPGATPDAIGPPAVGAGFEPAPTAPAVPHAPDVTPPPAVPHATNVTPPAVPQPKHHGLPEIVRGFKTFSARRVNEHRRTPGIPLWQRNYYEHIIRDRGALRRIRQYIYSNPAKWADDRNRRSTFGR